MAADDSSAPVRYESLAWDSAHYGMVVGHIDGNPASNRALERVLLEAAAAGARLVYYLHAGHFDVDAAILDRFGGKRVGGYTRLSRPIVSAGEPMPASQGLVLERYAEKAIEPNLIAMGIAASALSRFRLDQRLPAAKCDAMYTIWTERSLLGEIADEVLVAKLNGLPVGLTTFRSKADFFEIGLVSTAEAARGRGVARCLLDFTHHRMALRGCARSEVVTQTENRAACRLYERAGYTIMKQAEHYHFLFGSNPLSDN